MLNKVKERSATYLCEFYKFVCFNEASETGESDPNDA